MPKFVIECPSCGKFAEAKTGFFARKKIDCACGYTIDVRTDKLTSRECPHCGNTVVFDQSKGEKAKCPVCGEPINTQAEQSQTVEFSCAQCGVRLRTSQAATLWRPSSCPSWKSSTGCPPTPRVPSIPRSASSIRRSRWPSSGAPRTRYASSTL